MKKYILLRLIAVLGFSIAYFSVTIAQENSTDTKNDEISPRLSLLWQLGKKLSIPESVKYDAVKDILYVSNINGGPTDKNGAGFISKVSPDGKIEKLKWITGLDAPKGMGIRGASLFVTNIDELVEIDIEAGKIIKKTPVKGAKFLNDIAVDNMGVLYISDNRSGKIYKYKNNNIEEWMDFSAPNGLFIEDSLLYTGSFSGKGLFSININTKNKKKVCSQKSGIDGLIKIENGRFLVSDWLGKTSLIDADCKETVLINTSQKNINSADIEFIPGKNILIIPTFFDNNLIAFELKNVE